MHGEYWIQREECQIVCIIRKAKRYLDDFVMACFFTDGRVLFGEVRALVLGMQYYEWLSNCSESCHERQKKFVSFTDQSFDDVSQIAITCQISCFSTRNAYIQLSNAKQVGLHNHDWQDYSRNQTGRSRQRA